MSTVSTLARLAALAAVFLLAPGSAPVRHTFFNRTNMWQSFIGNHRKGTPGRRGDRPQHQDVPRRRSAHPDPGPRDRPRAPVVRPGRCSRSGSLPRSMWTSSAACRCCSSSTCRLRHPGALAALPLVPSRRPCTGRPRSSSPTRPTSRRSTGPGLNSVHRSQTMAARSLGLSGWTAMRYVILPQAIRNIIPPLLNDFISLQKDTALVGVIGAIEANQAASIYASTDFNYSSYVVAAILFLSSRSRWPVSPTSHPARPAAPAGRSARVSEPGRRSHGRPGAARQSRVEGLHKSFGAVEVLRGIDLAVDATKSSASSVPPGRASRRCCAASTCSNRSTPGGSCCSARTITGPRLDQNLVRRQSASCSSPSTCSRIWTCSRM